MLFRSRDDLASHGYPDFIVWALGDNERAIGFYEHLGGKMVRTAQERFGQEQRERVAFAFP